MPDPVLVVPKDWWRSRTLWLAVVMVVAGLGSLSLPGKVGAFVSILSGAAAFYLRTQTSAPLAGTALASPPPAQGVG
jgi:hypothetical protein